MPPIMASLQNAVNEIGPPFQRHVPDYLHLPHSPLTPDGHHPHDSEANAQEARLGQSTLTVLQPCTNFAAGGESPVQLACSHESIYEKLDSGAQHSMQNVARGWQEDQLGEEVHEMSIES